MFQLQETGSKLFANADALILLTTLIWIWLQNNIYEILMELFRTGSCHAANIIQSMRSHSLCLVAIVNTYICIWCCIWPTKNQCFPTRFKIWKNLWWFGTVLNTPLPWPITGSSNHIIETPNSLLRRIWPAEIMRSYNHASLVCKIFWSSLVRCIRSSSEVSSVKSGCLRHDEDCWTEVHGLSTDGVSFAMYE